MEDMAILKKISFFKDLTSGELIKVNIFIERAAFKSGEEIVKEGTVCDAFYIVKDGAVKVVKGKQQLDIIKSGEAVGELSFIDKGLRSATIIALEDTVLIKIPSDPFEKLLNTDKELAGKIYKAIAITLCRRLREANEALKLIRD